MVTISNYFNSSASTWFKSIEHLNNKEIFEFYINHFQTCIELFFFPHARREKKENEGRGQSFETLNPLLPIFWIETEAQINRSNLSLSKTNLSSRISRLRKRYFTNIERQKWHTPSSLPQLEYRIETVIPPPFPPFFSIYHWQTRDRGGGDQTRLGGQSSQTSSLSPLAKPLDPPRLVARLETCHYRGEFSRRRRILR